MPLHQTWEYLTETEVKANFKSGNKSSSILSSLLEKSRSKSIALENDIIELSLIVPCYNETERLHLLLEDAIPVLNLLYPTTTDNQNNTQTTTKSTTPKWELLLVDDGSSDGTAEYAVKWAAEQHTSGKLYLPPGTLRVVKLEKNRGKGGAVAHGMMHFRGKYAIFADADGASKSDDIRRLLTSISKKVLNNTNASDLLSTENTAWQYPVVAIGSRAHMVKTDAVVNRSFIRNFLMYGLHALVFIFGIRTIGDTQCGFKMFTRSAALSIFPYMHTEGWIFDVEILIIAMRNLIPVLEVPISWHEVAGSKVELARDSIKMAIDLVVMRLAFILGVYSDGSASSSSYSKSKKTLKRD